MRDTPSHAPTGHPAIDEQHERLAQIFRELDRFCEQRDFASGCDSCSTVVQKRCNTRLADIMGDLLSQMVSHFGYEERLMRLLPPTPQCMRHIEVHQKAHGDLSEHLSGLALKLDTREPRNASYELHQLIDCWMGNHTEFMDKPLIVALDGDYQVELQMDKELASFLLTPDSLLG